MMLTRSQVPQPQTQRFVDLVKQRIDPETIRVILDLGSRDGLQAVELQEHFPAARVFAFECNPAALEICKSNLAGTGIELIEAAVHDVAGSAQFFPALGNIGASSLFRKSGAYDRIENFTQVAPIEVRTLRLEEWAAGLGVERIDLVWADLQGAELMALRGLGNMLNATAAICTEVEYEPIYAGQPLFRDVDDFLLRHGFFCGDHRQVITGWWGEAVYFNTARTCRGATPRRLPFVSGGIGDLLQVLPDAIRTGTIAVRSHFAGAVQFFRRFGVEAVTVDEAYCENAPKLLRSRFLQLSTPSSAVPAERAGFRWTIGVHPFGSKFANDYATASGRPSKWMDPSFLAALLQKLSAPTTRFFVFCAPHEVQCVNDALPNDIVPHVQVIAEADVWDSLSMVTQCDCVVGVDSSIKTFAAMNRIPTVVLVGDYPDPFRDANFLQPYVDAGCMTVVRCGMLSAAEIERVDTAVKSALSGQGRRSTGAKVSQRQ